MSLDICRAYSSGEKINEEPLIYTFDNFINDAEMSALIESGRPELQRALVSTDRTGVVSKGRTGRNCWIKHHQAPKILQLAQRISKLVALPLENAESFQMIHYHETQEYSAHYDAWDSNTEKGQRCMARGGQRLVTCLLYLNDVEAGGGTCFPKLDIEVAAKRGRLLIFHNCFPGTNTKHPDSLHGGMPVLEGEKWACNLWFREKSRRVSALSQKTAGNRSQAKKGGTKKSSAKKNAGKKNNTKKKVGFG